MKFEWPRRGDLDNLDKFVMDALQGLIYTNDKQVQKQLIRKIYHRDGDCEGEIVIKVQQSSNEDLI